MRWVNEVTIIWTVWNDLEMRQTPNGKNVVSFSVATNESYTPEWWQSIEKTEWHNIVAWWKQAEILSQYVWKWSPLYIKGKLQTRNWEDEGSWKKMYRTDIILQSFQFLWKKSSDDSIQHHPEDTPQVSKNTEEEISVEDLPF
jgi:single-strand DNA-binding protein